MSKEIYKITLIFIALISFVAFLLMTTNVEALDPKLLWKKEFKLKIISVDLAAESGDVILGLENGREVILYDKDGNEKFHWGPRVDRSAGRVQISKDGKYFLFRSGYSSKYSEEKKLPWWGDDRIHYYDGQIKKEIWNLKSTEAVPLIYPDGSSIIVYYHSGNEFNIINSEGKKIFKYSQKIWSLPSFAISLDSDYFAVVGSSKQPLILFKRDGTKLWEKGRHNEIASISKGASYISTYPYTLGLSYVADPQNTHMGTVYDRKGNKILEGFGILSGNGTKIAMYAPDKITVLSLPNKEILKEIPIQVNLPKISNPIFAVFSHNGHYLILKSGTSLIVFDLLENTRKEITIQGLGRFPNLLLTKDGRYLLVHPRDWQPGKLIYYYQLY